MNRTQLRQKYKIDSRLKFKSVNDMKIYIQEIETIRKSMDKKYKISKEVLHFLNEEKAEVYVKRDKRFEFGYICDYKDGVLTETKTKVFFMVLNVSKKLKSSGFYGWILYDEIEKIRIKNGYKSNKN